MDEKVKSDKNSMSKAFNLVGVAIFKLREKKIDTNYENILEELKIDINDRINANKTYKALTLLLDRGYIREASSCYFIIDGHEKLFEAFVKRRVKDLENG